MGNSISTTCGSTKDVAEQNIQDKLKTAITTSNLELLQEAFREGASVIDDEIIECASGYNRSSMVRCSEYKGGSLYQALTADSPNYRIIKELLDNGAKTLNIRPQQPIPNFDYKKESYKRNTYYNSLAVAARSPGISDDIIKLLYRHNAKLECLDDISESQSERLKAILTPLEQKQNNLMMQVSTGLHQKRIDGEGAIFSQIMEYAATNNASGEEELERVKNLSPEIFTNHIKTRPNNAVSSEEHKKLKSNEQNKTIT